MVINSKLSDAELLQAIYSAAREYSNLIGNTYLIIGKNRNSDFFWFQCRFEKKHFMHLLGIDSRTLKATEFYDKCNGYNNGEDDGITVSDCTPSRNHSRVTLNEKCSCCADMLRIQDAKYMKVGLKDKISQYVDFSYAYGNMATLGFKAIRDTSVPVTLIPRNIDEFVIKKYKIVFVLKKKSTDKSYQEILMEAKEGLFSELYKTFPEDILNLCDNNLSKIVKDDIEL